MKIDEKNEALALSQKIIEEWFLGNGAFLYPYLSEDVVWIGSTEKQFYVGRPAVLDALCRANAEVIPCTLSQQNFFLGGAGTDTCLCIGRYVVTLDTEQMFMSEPQRVTFLWKMESDSLKISHIHLSNVAAVTAPDEEFPIAASKHNYEYFRRKLAEQDEIIRVSTTDLAFHLLSKSAIVYVEVKDVNIIIHYAGDEQFKVHFQLQAFLQKYCPDFVRIHRSYAVNPYHVRMLKGRKLTLDTGQILSVSRVQYAEFTARFDELF